MDNTCLLHDPIPLLKELIRVPSVNPPGDELRVAERLAEEFRAAGLRPELREAEPGRPNVVVRVGSGDSPHIWLNAHLDTVTAGDFANWSYDPFAAVEADGKIYGRGATDDKGGVAAMSSALISLAAGGRNLRGTVTFTGVVGEEAGNVGTKKLLQDGFKADMAIVGEYTSARRIAAGYRGCLWLRITTLGRSAHGSRPHQGNNAIDQMTDIVIPALRRMSFDYKRATRFLVDSPTVSINKIDGGRLVNVIPEQCAALVDIRLVPGQGTEEVLNQVERALREAGAARPDFSYRLETVLASEPFWTDPSQDLVIAVERSIRNVLGTDAEVFGKSGTSDGNVIAGELGIPVIAYGPGNGSGHGPDEYVESQDVREVARVLLNTLTSLCG